MNEVSDEKIHEFPFNIDKVINVPGESFKEEIKIDEIKSNKKKTNWFFFQNKDKIENQETSKVKDEIVNQLFSNYSIIIII